MNKFTMMKSIIFLIAISNMIVSFVDGGACWGTERMSEENIVDEPTPVQGDFVDYDSPERMSEENEPPPVLGDFPDYNTPMYLMEVMVTNVLFMHARDLNKLEEIIEEMAFNKKLHYVKFNFMVALPEKSSILKTLPDDLLEFEDNDAENAIHYQKEMASIIRKKLGIAEMPSGELLKIHNETYKDNAQAVERQESTSNTKLQFRDDDEDTGQPEIVEEYGGPSKTNLQYNDDDEYNDSPEIVYEHGGPSNVNLQDDDEDEYYGPPQIVEEPDRDDAPPLRMGPLARYRRTCTAPAIKEILLRKLSATGLNYQMRKAVDGVCRLLGVYISAKFPKWYIDQYRVNYVERTCQLSHRFKIKTYKIMGNEWFEQKANGELESLVVQLLDLD